MGAACCGATSGNDPEIEKATSLNEIIKILKVRAERFPKEKIEIEEYLSDKSKEITSFNSKGITDEALKLRVPYLNILKETFSAVENILSNHPKVTFFITYNPFLASFKRNKILCQ